MKDNCILLWPYEHCTEFTKQFIYANDENAEEEEFIFDVWEEYIDTFWLVFTRDSWSFQESMDEAIIEGFEMLGMPYDDEDVQRLYGLIE